MFPRAYFPGGPAGSPVYPPPDPSPAVLSLIEQCVRAWCLLQPGITALVGTRIYDQCVRQGVTLTPGTCAIEFKLISDEAGGNLDGSQSGDFEAELTLTCLARTEADLTALVQQVRGRQDAPALNGLTAQWLGSPQTRVWAQHVLVRDRPAAFAPDVHGADAGTWSADLQVFAAYYQP